MTNPCQLTTRAPFLTTDSSPRFGFPMLITWLTTVSSNGTEDDNVEIKISHGIVVKMTTMISTSVKGISKDIKMFNFQVAFHFACLQELNLVILPD